MNQKEILKKLEKDENYYGKFGKQYLSNSDISTLLKNPLALHTPQKKIPAFLVGGYFHTAILEPDKLKNFKIVESSTRNTKAYKEISGGELCLLQQEVDQIELMVDKMWVTTALEPVEIDPNKIKPKPKRHPKEFTMSELPKQCTSVLNSK